MNSRDTLTTPSSEGLQLGNDPLNAFSPLISIYYLVREKQERDRREQGLSNTSVPLKAPEKESIPEIKPPQEAHTNSSTYEMPGEKATGGRSRPRARTHGEDEVAEAIKNTPLPPAPRPSAEAMPEPTPKKESTAAGILRRLSTRRRPREPERLDKDRSHPPVVHVHSPAEIPSTPRKSFSIRRSRRDHEDHSSSRLRSGSSQPQPKEHRELLSPPLSAGGNSGSHKGLGRSTSVNSAEFRRRHLNSSRSQREPPLTSGSDHSTINEKSGEHKAPKTHSIRAAKSLGHARRESIQARRLRREREANVPEETDQELGEQSGQSAERLDDSELAKPVFLKGLFSVSTTSTRSVLEIRADIRRVLRQLGVDYMEIKGGFSCRHMPSIDLNKVADMPNSPAQTPGHRRRFSFGALRGGDRDREDMDRPPMTPRTPGKAPADRSDSNSDISEASAPRENGASSKRVPGETSTHVQNDLGGSMVLEFEIFIVKVPVLSLHGIQFKRMTGNTWQYKNMADQILKELRL